MVHIKDKNIQQNFGTVVTIGNFDGVHVGHQQLVKTTVCYAQKNALRSLVFSFDPHPKTVLSGQLLEQIFVPLEKARVLTEMGVDIFVQYPFDINFSKYSFEQFFEKILVDQLKCAAIVLGENSRLGSGRSGDITQIKQTAASHGITVFVKELLKEKNGANISSTNIRQALFDGDIKKANTMLGRNYFLKGTVETGDRRGSKIGFPTANIKAQKEKILPKNGVYVTKTTLPNGITHPSVTNIGTNPTFQKQDGVIIETHILDFDDNIYNQTIEVEFIERIRGEKKFLSIEELIAQIKTDAQYARGSLI